MLRGCNAVLDYLGTVTGTADEVNNVHAQALALRGFYYFRLVNIFGHPYNDNKDALGVPLKLNSGVEAELPSRKTVGEVYEQIVADLTEAERLYLTLPEEMQWKANRRTSLPMVELLLSRVYLYMEEWELAAKYAGKVMKNPKFSLYDLNNLPEVTEDGNPFYPAYQNYDCPEVIWSYGNTTDFTSWHLTESEDIGGKNYGIFKASDGLMASFDTVDLRKTKYVVREKHAWNEEYTPRPFGKMELDFRYMKPATGFDNARSLRLSEAYLNYAEAKAMLYKAGDAAARTEALDAINTLRTYRIETEEYETVEINDVEVLVAFVREERRRELCFEDHRWFDLRRYGMPEIKHTWNADETDSKVYTLREKDPAYTLPLPPKTLEANTNLEQNPKGSERLN